MLVHDQPGFHRDDGFRGPTAVVPAQRRNLAQAASGVNQQQEGRLRVDRLCAAFQRRAKPYLFRVREIARLFCFVEFPDPTGWVRSRLPRSPIIGRIEQLRQHDRRTVGLIRCFAQSVMKCQHVGAGHFGNWDIRSRGGVPLTPI